LIYSCKLENSMKSAWFHVIVQRDYGPDLCSTFNPGEANMTSGMAGNGKAKFIAEYFYDLFTRYSPTFWQREPPQTW